MRVRTNINTIEDFRKTYFSARTRFQRVVLALKFIIQTGFLFLFSLGWIAVNGMFFWTIIFSDKPTAYLPLSFLGVFLILGLCLHVWAIVRSVKFFRLVFSAPPIGNAPIQEFSEMNASGNPFISSRENDAPNEKSEPPLSTKARFAVGLMGALFFLVGLGTTFWGIKKYREEDDAAGTWISVPCKIVSAELISKSGDKGGVIYDPEIKFEYSVGGKKYSGDSIFFSGNTASSNYSKEKERLLTWKKQTTCWVNPNDFSESTLQPPQKGFYFRKVLLMLIGLPFMLVGGGVCWLSIVSSKCPAQTENVQVPNALSARKERRRASMLGLFFPAICWNGFVGAFIVISFRQGLSSKTELLFFIPFVLVGIGLLVAVIRRGFAAYNPRYSIQTFPKETLIPGETIRLSWALIQGDPSILFSLKVELVRFERRNIYVNGRRQEQEKVAERILVYETMSRTEIISGTTETVVPLHFSEKNWLVHLSGKTIGSIFRPNLSSDFLLTANEKIV